MSKIGVNINGVEIKTYSGSTILEVAREHGFEIPTLCQDDKLKHYGSCGMCVVELENNPKLIRSCSTAIKDGMIIKTNTDRIKASRKTTLELLLSDHQGDCKAPCMLGCPSNVDVQGYVGLAANQEYDEAIKLIKEDLPLPASIGRVCPHPCQTSCRRGLVDDALSIAWIKRYIADLDLKKEQSYMPLIQNSTGNHIAIIGGGPGGLSAAYFLRKQGHDVTIFEAMPEFGGMLKYGIPLYRLPKDVLSSEIQLIEAMGVNLKANTRIGRDITLDHINERFDAVYVSIGAWKSSYLRCPGIESKGIIGGIEFLNKFAINEPVSTGNKIAVIGGGNTAMDACRTAIRLGAREVYAIYRRTKEDMPAVDVEIDEAEEEGVVFKFLSNPIEFISDDSGKVTHIKLEKMKTVGKDASGRTKVEPTGEQEVLAVDSVIMSVGQKLLSHGFEALELNERGNIDINKSYMTSLEGVFAGGDAVNKGAGIAIEAIADGKNAAKVIERYLKGDFIVNQPPLYTVKRDVKKEDLNHITKLSASHMSHETPELRMHNFEEVVHGYTELEVEKEALRCLECGCMDSFECDLFKQANDYNVDPVRFKGEQSMMSIDDQHQYIKKDPNKCILCGMCVRICDDVMNQGILGFTDRGFLANVTSAFNKSLVDTDCIACGQCVSVCPTGALQEQSLIKKAVPLKGESTESICYQCGLGCALSLETKGDLLLRSLPNKQPTDDLGLLCVKGRFDFVHEQNRARLRKPLIKKNGQLEEVEFEEAILFIARKAQSINLRYGENSMASVLSGKYFNETIYLSKTMAMETFKTKHIYANRGYKKGLKDVLGYDASTNTILELQNTDVIITFGTSIMEKQPVLGVELKKATSNGVELIVVNHEKTQADQWANQCLYTEDLSLLKGVAKLLTEESREDYLLDELIQSLGKVEITEDAKNITKLLLDHKNVMFVVDRSALTDDAVMLIAEIAVLSKHIGRPRNGIIQLRDSGNTQGLVDLGINMDTQELNEKIEEGQIKGIVLMDDDTDIKLSDHIEFVMLQGSFDSPFADVADVIMPIPTYAETDGTMTSQERKIQYVRSAIEPITKMSNIDQLQEIIRVFNHTELKENQKLLEQIGKEIPEYLHVNKALNEVCYWPIGQSRILYDCGFNTASKEANFVSIESNQMYVKTDDSILEEKLEVTVN